MSQKVRIAAAIALVLALPTVVMAQEDPAAEEALAQAVSALNGSSFHFAYSVWPAQGANTPITGEGDFDRSTQSFSYNVVTDEGDATVDHANDGSWRMVGGVMYHDAGNGWQTGEMDFTHMAVTGMIAPFESYPFAKMFGSPEDGNLELLALAGTDEVDGVQAARYRFSTKELEVLGTGVYEAWVAGDPASPSFVVLQSTDADGRVNRVVYSALGEDVAITAP